tara:strand:+ start:987 stop:1178 length:192 start_codon:yes stop_codon:yes gene_type:complete
MNKFNKNLHKAISISYTLVGSLLFFGSLGYLLNKRFNDKNWFIGLLILGAIVGLYETYKQINK